MAFFVPVLWPLLSSAKSAFWLKIFSHLFVTVIHTYGETGWNEPSNFHVGHLNTLHKHYTTDDLVEPLEKAGFQNITTENHFMSKYWIAHKPELIA